MVFGDVERLEVVVVVLDLRTLNHFEPGVGEHPLDTFQGAGHRMQSAAGESTARQ